jgi:phasin family protein
MAAAKKTANKAEDLLNDAQKTFEANAAKFRKGLEEAAAFGQETLDALLKSSGIAAKAAEDLNAEFAAYSKKSLDDTFAAAKDLAAAKTPADLFEKQTAFATAALEGYWTQTAKWMETLTAATKDAAAPLATTTLAKAFAA